MMQSNPSADGQTGKHEAGPGQDLLKRGRKPRIVIVGGGFSGAYCAKTLEKALKDRAEVLVVDRHNYFIFYPLLIEAGTGMLAPTHAVVSIRSYLRRSNFLMAEVVDADFARRVIRVRPQNDDADVHGTGNGNGNGAGVGGGNGNGNGGAEQEVEYDHLVLALGSVTKFPPIPGLREHAYEIKSLAQTVALRDRAVHLLEQADATDDVELKRRLLHFVVVGGSYTGVEVAGEYHAYLREAAKAYPRLDEEMVRLTLIDRNDRILNTLPESLSRWAYDHLDRREGLEIRLKDSITQVTSEGVRLQSGGWLSCSTVIWAAGIAPPPLIEKLKLPVEHGWLACEADGRVKGHTDVWGVGDVAVNPDPKTGQGYPATAQHAIQEGVEAAKNIARVVRNEPTRPLIAKTRGTLAPLGRYDAVAHVFGIRVMGVLAWILWRGFYLTKVPGIGRAMHVFTDWLAAIVFGRDFVEMGVHRIVRAAERAAHAQANAQAGVQASAGPATPAAAVGSAPTGDHVVPQPTRVG